MSECAATSIIQRRVREVRICAPHSLINYVNHIRCVNGRVASVVADVANREERPLKVGEDVVRQVYFDFLLCCCLLVVDKPICITELEKVTRCACICIN